MRRKEPHKEQMKPKFLTSVIFILMLLTSADLYACTCKNLGSLSKLRKLSYDNSEIIFLGNLVGVDSTNNTYAFEIVELFKGQSQSNIIKGKYFDSCSVVPSVKGKWIVYANFEDGFINIDECLASRSKRNPFCVNCYSIPPPPPEETTLHTKIRLRKAKKFLRDLITKMRKDWKEETEILRQLKRS